MTIKIIGILGSPLSEGNTAKLLEESLRGARDAGCDVETLAVTSLEFEACMEMMFCRDHPMCVMDDDMQKIYPKFRDMDGLILATPVMTMGVPGKLKSFMDRFQVFFMAKYVRKEPLIDSSRKKKRKGLFIAIAGMDIPEVFVGMKLTTKAFFDIIDCAYSDELLIPGMDTIQAITTRSDLMEAAYKKGYDLGKSLSDP